MADAKPLLITVAPNGARKTKADHKALPITPAEIAATAKDCAVAGADMLHLHVRDEAGGHSLNADHYKAAIDAVQAAVGDEMIIQITTEAVGIYSQQEQMDCVRAVVPEAASFALRELVPQDGEEAAWDFFAWVKEAGILSQFILYDTDDVQRFLTLKDAGMFPFSEPHALFVLGRHSADGESDPADLKAFVENWPMSWPWSVCAFGRAERKVAELAIQLGGHVRVGFENNLLAPDGKMLCYNVDQVEAVAQLATQHGRRLASAEEATALFT